MLTVLIIMVVMKHDSLWIGAAWEVRCGRSAPLRKHDGLRRCKLTLGLILGKRDCSLGWHVAGSANWRMFSLSCRLRLRDMPQPQA